MSLKKGFLSSDELGDIFKQLFDFMEEILRVLETNTLFVLLSWNPIKVTQ